MIWFNVQNFLRDTINIYDFMGNDFVHDTSNGKFDFDKMENLGFNLCPNARKNSILPRNNFLLKTKKNLFYAICFRFFLNLWSVQELTEIDAFLQDTYYIHLYLSIPERV